MRLKPPPLSLPIKLALTSIASLIILALISYLLIEDYWSDIYRQGSRSQLIKIESDINHNIEKETLKVISDNLLLVNSKDFIEAFSSNATADLFKLLKDKAKNTKAELISIANSHDIFITFTKNENLKSQIKKFVSTSFILKEKPFQALFNLDKNEAFVLTTIPFFIHQDRQWLINAIPITEYTHTKEWQKDNAKYKIDLIIKNTLSPVWHPLDQSSYNKEIKQISNSIWSQINLEAPHAGIWLTPYIDGIYYDARFKIFPIDFLGENKDPALGFLIMTPSKNETNSLRAIRDTLIKILTAGAILILGINHIISLRFKSSLQNLSSWARNFRPGSYNEPPKNIATKEIKDLIIALNLMQKNIRQRENEMMHLAYRDTLTNLPNREKFRHELRKIVLHNIKNNIPCSILIMDLDRFKRVNDALGHNFGDRLLRVAGQRLRDEVLDESMLLARFGGDEFAILLPRANIAVATQIAKHIQHAFERPLTLDSHTIDLRASLGISSYPTHSDEADELIRRAEISMYSAKQQQSSIVIFQPTLDANTPESLSLLTELRQAIENNQLQLFLQPKINLVTEKLTGAEALIRWTHPERGLIPPAQFIPFAEQTGFIRLISLWIIERTIELLCNFNKLGLDIKISVNLSTRDLVDQELPSKIDRLIKKYKLNPRTLILEITESATMDDPDRALKTLESLHALGLKLSIDDFGTGYSSLAYLKRLPVDELKIDKSFVGTMEQDLDDAKIVRSTIDLAHNLGLRVVAEGIENKQIWKLLKGLHCDEAQGYFISRPMPAEEFYRWSLGWQPPEMNDVELATDFSNMI